MYITANPPDTPGDPHPSAFLLHLTQVYDLLAVYAGS